VAATKKTTAASKQAAPKQAAARQTAPKRPPRRADFGAPIGPWFEQWPPEKRVPLEELRRLVEATVPAAASGLKWRSPFWTLDGKILCNVVALKHEVALGIYAPPEAFDDPQGQLSGRSDEYRVLKVKDGTAIDAASVRRWLTAAVAARR
jgi:hypothetical protein